MHPASSSSVVVPGTHAEDKAASSGDDAAGPRTPLAAGQAPTPLSEHALRASLRHSIYDGCGWGVMHGAGERYIPPLVILSYAGLWPLAAISALPGLIGAITQCVAAIVIDRLRARKQILITVSCIQALSWLPMMVSLYLSEQVGYGLLLASFALYVCMQNFGYPAWNSLMGEIVPAPRRGRYFGLRNALLGGAILITFFLGGAWLDQAGKALPWLAQTPLAGATARQIGFTALFLLALGARFFSIYHLTFMPNLAYQRQSSDNFTFWQFARRAPFNNFGRFVIYWAGMHVSIGFLGPYMSWQLLENLEYSPSVFATIQTMSFLGIYASQPLWGRLADRIGNRRTLVIGSLGCSATPLLLALCGQPLHFALVYLIDGTFYAALQLSAANYLFDAVTPGKRVRCTAYMNVAFAGGLALGNVLGALAALNSPALGWAAFSVLLAGSAVLRALVQATLLRAFGAVAAHAAPPADWPTSS